jgi:hypothetical protein
MLKLGGKGLFHLFDEAPRSAKSEKVRLDFLDQGRDHLGSLSLGA